jgi:hypothetical protein
MSRELEPPFVLDAARVVRYAALDFGRAGQRTGVVVSGVAIDAANLAHVAIAEALLDGTIFLLHCNDRWETVGASHHPDVQSAERAAAATYGSALPAWTPYRPLTDEEEREIQTTRAFLRDLAAEEFGG